MAKRYLIIGGVAGGASAAARLRRRDEQAEIVIFERGAYVSFANCGLPYYVGGEIAEREELLLHTPESLRARFNLDVRVRHEVIEILPARQEVRVRNLDSGVEQNERYDELILATGANAAALPIPGLNLPGVFTLRTIPDVDAISAWLTERRATSALVVGGGYIGLEAMEQLVHRGLKCALLEGLPQVMAPLDAEMAELVHAELRREGVSLCLNEPLAEIRAASDGKFSAQTKSGRTLQADIVIVALGVRPASELAARAGLAIGERGGVKVSPELRTSDAHIWAVGDCIEVDDLVLGRKAVIALAGPANRQGRMVADNITGGARRYHGTLGTAALRAFRLTAAVTGASERALKGAGKSYEKVYLFPNSHAGYYPGAAQIALKLLFCPQSGEIFGAQAVGADGVDKRIDVVATLIKAGGKIDDLADLELCYAPPLGSAKDALNIAGMMAQNVREGLVRVVHWHAVAAAQKSGAFFIDVRSRSEFEAGAIPGATHMPLPELRKRLSEVPRDREVIVYCASGQRSYYACRILAQHGVNCANLSGAFKMWSLTEGLR